MNHFKGKQFQQDVIIVAVGYYLRYNLSYREVQEILYDRGINVSIRRFIVGCKNMANYSIKFGKKNKKSFYSWKMDETYIKIKGKWHYLYRAIDADGLTLDIWLRKKRDTQAAYAFLKRLVKQFDEPKVVVTDKAPSITSAFKKLEDGFYQGTEHRTIKYLNNLIEQDHRPVKRDAINSIEVYALPLPRLKAWKPFEDYIRKPEKKALSSGFRSVLKSRYYWESQLKS